MKIIILTGKARSGKNQVASIIEKNLDKNAITISYAYYLKEYAKNILNWDGVDNTKPRTFLQELGDYVKSIDKNFLINRLLQDIEVYKKYFDVIIISDARFVEEINCIKKKYTNVDVIHIEGLDNNLTELQKKHITEVALDNYYDYDFKIENKKTLSDLEKNVLKMMEEIKW